MIERHLNQQQKALIGTLLDNNPLNRFEIDKQYHECLRELVRQKLVKVDSVGRHLATTAGIAALETGKYERQPLRMPIDATRPTLQKMRDSMKGDGPAVTA